MELLHYIGLFPYRQCHGLRSCTAARSLYIAISTIKVSTVITKFFIPPPSSAGHTLF